MRLGARFFCLGSVPSYATLYWFVPRGRPTLFQILLWCSGIYCIIFWNCQHSGLPLQRMVRLFLPIIRSHFMRSLSFGSIDSLIHYIGPNFLLVLMRGPVCHKELSLLAAWCLFHSAILSECYRPLWEIGYQYQNCYFWSNYIYYLGKVTLFLGLSVFMRSMVTSPLQMATTITGDSAFTPIRSCFATLLLKCFYTFTLGAFGKSMLYIKYRSLCLPRIGTSAKWIGSIFLSMRKIVWGSAIETWFPVQLRVLSFRLYWTTYILVGIFSLRWKNSSFFLDPFFPSTLKLGIVIESNATLPMRPCVRFISGTWLGIFDNWAKRE